MPKQNQQTDSVSEKTSQLVFSPLFDFQPTCNETIKFYIMEYRGGGFQ